MPGGAGRSGSTEIDHNNVSLQSLFTRPYPVIMFFTSREVLSDY